MLETYLATRTPRPITFWNAPHWPVSNHRKRLILKADASPKTINSKERWRRHPHADDHEGCSIYWGHQKLYEFKTDESWSIRPLVNLLMQHNLNGTFLLEPASKILESKKPPYYADPATIFFLSALNTFAILCDLGIGPMTFYQAHDRQSDLVKVISVIGKDTYQETHSVYSHHGNYHLFKRIAGCNHDIHHLDIWCHGVSEHVSMQCRLIIEEMINDLAYLNLLRKDFDDRDL